MAGAVIAGGSLTATPPSLQAASAGTIRVAIRPGALRAAAIARAVSGPTPSAVAMLCTQSENGCCHRLDVGLERRGQALVGGAVLADDVDHRAARAPRVVDVGEAVGEARPEMQQGRGGLAGHAGIAVGGTGDDALEQPEHAARPAALVERRQEMHLGGPGIGEADLDPAGG